jgi:hypothetical protein
LDVNRVVGRKSSEAGRIGVMSEHAEARYRYQAYRRAAMQLRTAAVRVSETATVWPTVGGAFVEASIWIPDAVLDAASVPDDEGPGLYFGCGRHKAWADAPPQCPFCAAREALYQNQEQTYGTR